MKKFYLILFGIEMLCAMSIEFSPGTITPYDLVAPDLKLTVMHAIFSEDYRVLEPVIDRIRHNKIDVRTLFEGKSILQQAIAFQKTKTIEILVDKLKVPIFEEDVLFAQERHAYYYKHRLNLLNRVLTLQQPEMLEKFRAPLPSYLIYEYIVNKSNQNKVINEAFSHS